ncbi:MAG: hypothetical protein LBS21_03815 [Clostridiales bacterium]|jgi:hypothetical protein|nr:hypothetical protein [Clostridiales bacterium]
MGKNKLEESFTAGVKRGERGSTAEYHKLKDEVMQVEQIKRGILEIVREEHRREHPQRSHDHSR